MDKRVLVVGDAMLDSYRFGEVNRISPEAPVPVFLEKGRKKHVAGGAANVAVNISAIGVPTDLFAMVGEDEYGHELKKRLTEWKVNTELVLKDSGYITTSKLRYIGPGNQQILRVDSEDTHPVEMERLEGLFEELEKSISKYSVIVLSDYLKGFLTEQTTKRLIGIANDAGIPVLVDVKDKNADKYRGATLLKPNRKELAELSGRCVDNFEAAIDAAKELCVKASCRYVLATLGADGMILVNAEGLVRSVKSMAREVFDVTGAGDTSIAYLAAEIADGASFEEAMVVSNYAAGVQVSKAGTSVVFPDEVFAAMMDEGQNAAGKELNLYFTGGLAPL
jgi:D-beta-D-heptose 7-phosphate kinase/D-beta-D-heptose 1-phosphate adenosyltransferase